MTDILSDALQKISDAESERRPVEADVLKSADDANAVTEMPEAVAVCQSPVNNAPAAQEHSRLSARSIVPLMLENRRRSIAVVVVVCMAAVWFDDGAFVRTQPAQEPGMDVVEEFGSEDFTLSDFDAVEVSSMREPADPIESPASDPFPLTIPQMEDDSTAFSTSSGAHTHPLLTGQLDVGDPHHDHEHGTLPVSQVPQDVPASNASTPRSVKFTGRIQPLN